jgi:hypothetical protein
MKYKFGYVIFDILEFVFLTYTNMSRHMEDSVEISLCGGNVVNMDISPQIPCVLISIIFYVKN